MLKLKKQLEVAATEYEISSTKRLIESIDKQIDELVYELYGLTEEERKIVGE